jgi:glyoxylate reductase
MRGSILIHGLPGTAGRAKTADVLTVTDRRPAAEPGRPAAQPIAQFGTGVDNIDLGDGANRSIIVTNTPGVLTEDTADMTMALILAVPRPPRRPPRAATVSGTAGHRPGCWATARPRQEAWHRFGMGRIGRRGQRARASACGTTHQARRGGAGGREALEATYWDSLDQMLARWNHLNQPPAHAGDPSSLSARRLAPMKPSAYIVNTARGEDRRTRCPHDRERRVWRGRPDVSSTSSTRNS